MRRMVLGMMAALGACASPKEAGVKWPTLDGKPPLIIAHRGASGYLPEHTLEAYALAIEQGADVIEPDLVFTKDGVLVARHDRYLSTTTNVADKPEFAARRRPNADPSSEPREDWWVEDFTLAELKTLRARQPFPGRTKEHDDKFEIPTFAEMLALVAARSKDAGRPVGVYPETKHPGYFASIGHDFEAPLLEALAGFDAGPVFIQSFEPEILKRLKGKTYAKLVQLVYIAPFEGRESVPTPNISLSDLSAYADGVGAEKRLRGFTSFDDRRAHSSFIGEAHALGLFVHLWTFRDDRPDLGAAQAWSELLEDGASGMDVATLSAKAAGSAADYELRIAYLAGADGVFADFPDTAVKVKSAAFSGFETK